MIKRAMVFAAIGLAAACVSTAASAHAGVGVYLGGPVYAAPPPVYYAPPPPVVYSPPPVYYGPPPVVVGGYYGNGYGYYRPWHHHHHYYRGW